MPRLSCNDNDWVFGAPLKARLFDLWFRHAERMTAPYTAKELERVVGARGPNALRSILPRLLSLGLVRKLGDRYQPVPLQELSPGHQELRLALAALLMALEKV